MTSVTTTQIIDRWEELEGASAPLGCTWIETHQSYNFALYSRHAEAVSLLLFRASDPARPAREIVLDPLRNKTQRVWHYWLTAAEAGDCRYYAYRVHGPNDPASGHRFDSSKVLLDPFAHDVFFPPAFSRTAACNGGPTAGLAPLGVLPPRQTVSFDWEGDRPPRHTHDLIVYELHVKGFTAHPSSGVRAARRGTFAGLIDKIPYLTSLGVTAVELMPIHQVDPQEGSYWGYMTLSFFAPNRAYAEGVDAHREFKQLVKAMHRAGIEVWIDVVYNHTAEGDHNGPTYSYRGIDNSSYYLLGADKRQYVNASGTGNTLRCGDPAVRTLILNSLSYWSRSMRVDGFRFDLASILTRDSDGTPNGKDPALIHEISSLARSDDVRLVAEAWDVSTYQLGRGFPGTSWRQWNGKYRDDLRDVVRGEPGRIGDLMRRLYGSDDLFSDALNEACRPYQSVNFITAHDGFCLYDLVAYNHKHNEANGHNNTDGTDDNRSWNCGWEGDDGAPPEVLALRKRQVRNFFTLLMLSNGTPMFCAGDEFLNTQQGNNNPYNQDNEISWLDWRLLERNADTFRFFQQLIAFRKAHRSIGRSRYWRDDVHWYGTLGPVDLGYSRTLAYFLNGASVGDDDLYVMINMYWEPLDFRLQVGQPAEWRRVVDTARPSPDDVCEPGHEALVDEPIYRVGARSVVVLRRPKR